MTALQLSLCLLPANPGVGENVAESDGDTTFSFF